MFGGATSSDLHGSVEDTDGILAALERGATLLVPTVRAARFWADRYDAHAAPGAGQSWQAAAILPWRTWTAAMWQELVISGRDERVLLNDEQERALWSGIIARHSVDSLRSATLQAALCMDASKLLGSYDVDSRFLKLKLERGGSTTDAATFQQWFAAFQGVCRREAYLSPSQLEGELASVLQGQSSGVRHEYVLHGFQELLPSQRLVVEALSASGADVQRTDPRTGMQHAPALLRCGNPEDELQACAAWVREWIETHPEGSIALVVPDLAAARTELERELRTAIAPAAADVTRTDASVLYEFSAGRALRQLPMVRDALTLLRWCAQDVSLDDAGSVLRSPFLTLAESPEAGAEQDLHVLRAKPRLRKTLSLRQAGAALKEHATANRLLELDREARACRNAGNTFAWLADHVRKLLQVAGWPGEATLSSDEFQAADRWDRMLDQLASLDLLGQTSDLRDFVQQMESLAGRTLFAPENLGAPVQVMSLGEAAGTTVDALWFLHAGAGTWPVRHASHPLLPLRLQKELGMPGTDLQRDERAAREHLEGLLGSAGSLRFSWNGGSGDDAAGPSPLVEQFVLQHGGSITEAVSDRLDEAGTPLLERICDDEPLPVLREGHVGGGTGVLTAQAQCGFRAFAEKRLFAQEMEALDAGLSPRERGEQVHAVLQMFWDEVKDKQTLLQKSSEKHTDGRSGRDVLLQQCIADVCKASGGEHWDSAYLRVQEERLFRLLSAWLGVEEGRPPFRVLQTEAEIRNVPIGPLRLNMRVDRIDQVTAPSYEGTLLIDYKTGVASPGDWLTERPDAPQLPAYAVAGAPAAGLEHVEGVAFASIRVGSKNMRLDGMAESPTLIGPKAREKHLYSEQVEHWRNDLRVLAEAFASGDASVCPKDYPRTCSTCGQRMLCRVDAATLREMDEPQTEQDGDEAAAWN